MLNQTTEVPVLKSNHVLEPNALYQNIDLTAFTFDNTAEIQRRADFNLLNIQTRALETLDFSRQTKPKQHLFVYAQSQSELQQAIADYLLSHSASDRLYDWVYLPNFSEPQSPRLIRLSCGEGQILRQKIKDFVKQLYLILPAALNATSYTARFESLEKELQTSLLTKEGCEADWNTPFSILNEEVSQAILSPLLKPLQADYADDDRIIHFLQQLEEDFKEQLPILLQKNEFDEITAHLRRYQVNLFQRNHSEQTPIVYEDMVTLNQVFGQVLDGDNAIDVLRIRAGAIHRANGGYLLLDAEKVIQNPELLDKLKVCLLNQSATLPISEEHNESAESKVYPEAMPLDIQVMLYGRRSLHNRMCNKDVILEQLFGLALDFQYEVNINTDTLDFLLQHMLYKIDRQGLLPFSKQAIARIIEAGQRYIDDRELIGIYESSFNGLLVESSFIAQYRQASTVELEDVNSALSKQEYRQNRLAQEQQQEILRKFLLIETDGYVVAQVNGLFIIELGTYSYGLPARITATAGIGEGEVLDIERESELGGSLHSKGVMILSSYLVSIYGRNKPISLMASLVLEQSYSQVDGDSASAGELCALLSALANVGINQSIGITGSVNQRGELQAIGGVNEKVEAFYSLCAERGKLDGTHGVIIPQANVSCLMLNENVIQAVTESRFSIYAVSDINRAMEILTDVQYSEIYQRVDAQLNEFAKTRQEYNK